MSGAIARTDGEPPAYVDPATGETFPITEPRWRSPAAGPLMITPLPGVGRDMIETHCRSLWRYARALPLVVPDPITMGEGCTPLVFRNWRGVAAGFKLEWFSPTGSFKDRGASVMLSILRQQGVTGILEDSSGNGGAAIAAYAAAGGLKAKILVPASAPPGKTVQMRAYGAEIELVPGSRQDTAEAALRQAETIFYASHNWHPFFLQGTKTLAYELWEDLGVYQKHIEDLELRDYRVRVFQGGTDAVTRVLIEFGDGAGDTWSTVGVSGNIIDASFQALVDAITYRLFKLGVPAQ